MIDSAAAAMSPVWHGCRIAYFDFNNQLISYHTHSVEVNDMAW